MQKKSAIVIRRKRITAASKLSESLQTGLRLLMISLLILGIVFRFANLDRKVYWLDETYTSLRISGYTTSELAEGVQPLSGRAISVEDLTANLQKYQQINTEKSLIDTVRSLVLEDPQHPPLYYIIARFWSQWFGSSPAVIKSLSAFVSLLIFPCVYWLCLELFESNLIGLVAMGMIAISPLHLLYAQEARQYVLWTSTILLSSASFIHAMRRQTKGSWLIYAATVAVGLYTFLFSALVVFAHGIDVLVTEQFRWSKMLKDYLKAILLGFMAFVPWLIVIAINAGRFYGTTIWTTQELETPLIGKWLQNLSYAFFDLQNNYNNLLAHFLLIFTLFIVVYAIYFLYRSAPKQAWLVILTLTATASLPLMLPDLILGGKRSTIVRYLIPSYLGIQLAVVYLVTTKVIFPSVRIWQQNLWRSVMAILVVGGVLSCTLISQAQSSWHQGNDYYIPQIAHTINQTKQPLVVSSIQPIHHINKLLSLNYMLKPEVSILLWSKSNKHEIFDKFSDVFLFFSSEQVRSELQKEYEIYPVHQEGNLWWLKKR